MQAFVPLRPSPISSSSPALRPLTQAYLFGLGGSNSKSSNAKNGNMKTLTPRPFAPENMKKYDDDVFARVWIFLFSGKIAAVVGAPYPRTFIPYEEYVRLSQLLLKGGSTKAKTAVLSVLRSIAFPGFSSIFRTLFPGTSRFACEFNAKVTPVFFSWLVGPAVVETSEMRNPKTYVYFLGGGREGGREGRRKAGCVRKGGRKCLFIAMITSLTHKHQFHKNSGEVEVWANSVKIERCRYLESVQCKGACANICKLPTQTFFTEDLGMPVTMKPNFDDLR